MFFYAFKPPSLKSKPFLSRGAHRKLSFRETAFPITTPPPAGLTLPLPRGVSPPLTTVQNDEIFYRFVRLASGTHV